MIDENAPLRSIKGVGEKTEQLFHKMGVYTVGDILLHFPRTYQVYPSFAEHLKEDDEPAAFLGWLKKGAVTRRGKRMEVTTATVFGPDEAEVQCVWFHMPYLSSQLKKGQPTVFYGRLEREHGRLKMEQPAVFSPEQYQRLLSSYQPVYALTQGMRNTTVRKTMQSVLGMLSSEEKGEECFLPEQIMDREGFLPYYEALQKLHFPSDFSELAGARDRLVYQEFFYFILFSRSRWLQTAGAQNNWSFLPGHLVDEIVERLPFTLTKGQQEALKSIREDFRGPAVSQRLLQGDVGSGKTIVAFLAMVDAAESGYQSALMAPTEVLAMQHYESFCRMCREYQLPFEVVCLVGSMTAKEKREAREKINATPGLLIVGTHALIQEKVVYRELALVVTDEQHRFGVRQREQLSRKGNEPHILVMSATPIPRTLAMILYSNMQISSIRELPAHRLPIKTCVIRERLRTRAYQMIGEQLKEGRQAYIICPLVEAKETTEAENVRDYVKKIKDFFGKDVVICGLHGKMPAREKNQIMEDFGAHKIQILVSTTVVEVGINVPNATVILIENANRFGLAQLHQLRGRVGRGTWQSYCILMDQSKGTQVEKRLEVMCQSGDGFYIAEEDLRLRGPGDFFGIRQSGELNFKLADIIGDANWLKLASGDVNRLLAEDPGLKNHPMIARKLDCFAEDDSYIL